jgi:hypothetical protein
MAKRTRRERRLDADKQQGSYPPFDETDEAAVEVQPAVAAPTQPAASAGNGRGAVNFAQEYFYVFSEVKGLLIITGILFVVMIGLTFVI